MAVCQDLPARGEEEISKEVIPSKGEGDSLAHQSFKEAFLAGHGSSKTPSGRNDSTISWSQ